MPENMTQTPRVLLIEESPEQRTLARGALEPAGFEVLEARDGLGGIDLAIRQHPDLILIDIALSGIDGYETASRLRSYRGLDGCPIVVLTASGDRGLALSVGCDGYIEKPLDATRLPDQLRAYIKGKREKVRAPEERRLLREYSQSLSEKVETTVRELSQANAQLVAAARSKSEFMQNLSHELASPLTPITGYLKMLRSEKMGPINEAQGKALESMALSVERLSRTIDNLVDFASLEGGAGEVNRAPFEVVAMVKGVFDAARAKAKARRVQLRCLGAATHPGFGDERKLRQALSNLIDNAIKFSPHGSEVLVCIAEEPQRLVFDIYDSGAGVMPDEGLRVFEPFFHADRGGEGRAPGAGLGLPVVRQIIEAHGGTVQLESPPKTQPDNTHYFSGTKLTFWIPARGVGPDAPATIFSPDTTV